MVLPTIIAPSSEHTIYFDQPFKKPNYIRILLCTFHNSWCNLKKEFKISVATSGEENKRTIVAIKPGYYISKSLAKTITEKFAEWGVEFLVKAYTAQGWLMFLNPKFKKSIGLPSPYTTFLFDVGDN